MDSVQWITLRDVLERGILTLYDHLQLSHEQFINNSVVSLRLCPFPNERYSPSSGQTNVPLIITSLERRTSTRVEPSCRFNSAVSSETRAKTTARYVAHALLVGSGVVCALTKISSPDNRSEPQLDSHWFFSVQLHVARRCRDNRLRTEWPSGIRLAILSQVVFRTITGAAEEASRLLSSFWLSKATLSICTRQV